MRTLTVDDKITVVKMIELLLKRIKPDWEHFIFTDPNEALAAAKEQVFDVAFLDVEMPDMNGIELAKRLQVLNPRINIIFITGYEEYMPKAFALHASGYLMKPVTETALREELNNLRHTESLDEKSKPVKVRCFGAFEVFVNDTPVWFSRSKCKELFAYLVDRRGAVCTSDMIIAALWPDEQPDDTRKNMVRIIIGAMKSAFSNVGVDNALIRYKTGIAVNTAVIDCDYYRWLDGEPNALRQFMGEYMTQYDFAEETRNVLVGKMMQMEELL